MADRFEKYKVSESPVDRFEQYKIKTQEPESLGTSAGLAFPRLYEDATKGLYKAAKSIPGYLEKAKTEIPGILNPFGEIAQNPFHAAAQGLAGIAEGAHGVLNIPSELANYASNRLNLLSPEISKKVPRLPDISEELNQVFGQPKYPGEAAIRGIGRNILPISGAIKALSAIPHLTERGATKKLKNARQLSDERNIGKLNIDPDLVKDARQFLPKTSPHRKNLKTAGKGDYDALFRLQSDLGKHSADYAKSLFSAAERQHGRAGLASRNRLLDAIHENLQSKGHHDISDLLRRGQNDYRRYAKFKPYRNALAIGALSLAIPNNPISKILTKFLFHNNR